MSNHWQKLHMQREHKARNPHAHIEQAGCDRANENPDIECGNCGKNAQYRMTIGTHQCPHCYHIFKRWFDKNQNYREEWSYPYS